MKDFYTLQLCGCERHLPFVPISEDTAFASFVILSDTELISAAAEALSRLIPECDYILTAEAKGIALSFELSRRLGMKEFIVARKGVKSYMKDVHCVSVCSITTKGEQRLYLDGGDTCKLKGKRVCIVDDVISTGESLRAIEALALSADAQVVCRAAVLAEGNAAERDDIVFLQKLPLFQKNSDGEYQPI